MKPSKPDMVRVHPTKLDEFVADIVKNGDELVDIHRNLSSFDVYVRRKRASLLDDDGRNKGGPDEIQEKTKRDRGSSVDW